MNDGVIGSANSGTIMIDTSTIGVEIAQNMYSAARAAGFEMIDAPDSGGVTGASSGTLTLMFGVIKKVF